MNVRTRRRWWIGAATTTGVAMLVVGALLPVPFVELAPGPTFNVIGDVDGKPLIEISGTPTYPVDGNLDMTTVNERGGPGNGVYLGRVLVGWADPHIRIVPREAIYPEDQSVADLEAENVRSFSDSESDSTAAALRYLKRPYLTLVVVASVIDGTPADGKLEPGDQILQVERQGDHDARRRDSRDEHGDAGSDRRGAGEARRQGRARRVDRHHEEPEGPDPRVHGHQHRRGLQGAVPAGVQPRRRRRPERRDDAEPRHHRQAHPRATSTAASTSPARARSHPTARSVRSAASSRR